MPLGLKCGSTMGVRGDVIWLHASDGQRLYAVEAGDGATAVILVPESPPGDVCGWLPYAATLQRAGMRVLAFDYRGTGESPVAGGKPFDFGRDLTAAVDRARSDGAQTVVVAGASFGGVVAMQYGSAVDVDGVVSLSGETRLPEYHVDAVDNIARLHKPLLILGTRADSYLSVDDARRLLRGAGSSDKRLVLYPGSWHGWEIVESAPFAARARALVLAWLRAR